MGVGPSTDSLNNTGVQTRWMYWSDLAKRAKPGDLIEFSRSFTIGCTNVPYKICGHRDKQPYVIHYSNPGDRTSSNERSNTDGWIPDSFQQNGTATELFGSYIREDVLSEIAASSQCRINNSQDYRNSPFRPAEILRRARSRLDEGGYSLYSSNCEHFARWARNGTWVSLQLSVLTGGAAMALDGPDSALGRMAPSVHSTLDYDRAHPHVDYRTKKHEPGFFETLFDSLFGIIEGIFMIIKIIAIAILGLFFALILLTPRR